MGTVHIPTLLEGILEATAAEAHAKARITTLRAALEDEARRRMAADGAAPSWNAAQLGKVRLDPAGAWEAKITAPEEFGSYVAEHYPTEAGVVLYLNAADAADALQALEFIGVTPTNTRVEVRPAWADGYLKGLDVDVTEERDDSAQVTRTVVAADTTTGAVVPGIGVTRSEAKLVVSLDRDRRTAAITEARSTATALVEAASGDDDAPVDLDELDRRRVELEGLHGDALAAIAKGHGLGSSGTKASLAERIARAELATGNVIRPAAALPAGPVGLRDREQEEAEHIARLNASAPLESVPGPLPEGTEVEEVTTVPAPREPYVGDGADGCRRSAEIDRTEAEGYDRDDARVEERLASAAAWEAQAATYPDAGHVDPYDAGQELDKAHSREALRKAAKAHNLSAAGTKAEVIGRLVAAGVTADNLTVEAAS